MHLRSMKNTKNRTYVCKVNLVAVLIYDEEYLMLRRYDPITRAII